MKALAAALPALVLAASLALANDPSRPA